MYGFEIVWEIEATGVHPKLGNCAAISTRGFRVLDTINKSVVGTVLRNIAVRSIPGLY